MAHDGMCFRNSKHGPSIAEEHQVACGGNNCYLIKMVMNVGNDGAIFVKEIHSENDASHQLQ
jgi:hypothetical protein